MLSSVLVTEGAHTAHLNYTAQRSASSCVVSWRPGCVQMFTSGEKGWKRNICSKRISGKRCHLLEQMQIRYFCSTATIIEITVHSRSCQLVFVITYEMIKAMLPHFRWKIVKAISTCSVNQMCPGCIKNPVCAWSGYEQWSGFVGVRQPGWGFCAAGHRKTQTKVTFLSFLFPLKQFYKRLATWWI